jgi:hypothetical protein
MTVQCQTTMPGVSCGSMLLQATHLGVAIAGEAVGGLARHAGIAHQAKAAVAGGALAEVVVAAPADGGRAGQCNEA